MTILGLGVDVVEINRFKKIKNNKKIIKRIFTTYENRYCENKNKILCFPAWRVATNLGCYLERAERRANANQDATKVRSRPRRRRNFGWPNDGISFF